MLKSFKKLLTSEQASSSILEVVTYTRDAQNNKLEL